jgi:flagellar biosynthesis protein FliQ
MAEFEGLLRDALVVTALLTIPILAIATLVGAGVAILQAAAEGDRRRFGRCALRPLRPLAM